MISMLVAGILSLAGGIFIGKIGIKKSVIGTLLLWIIVLASLEWNASLYDFIFLGIFNKKYFISSRHFPWLLHYLGSLQKK